MKYSLQLSLFLMATSSVFAEETIPTNSSDPHFVFLSGEISALIKEDYVEVESFDGKRLNFSGKAKSAKPSNKQPCFMKPVVAISNHYATVSELEFSFRSLAATLRADRAMSEMAAEQMRFAAGQDFEASNLGAEWAATNNIMDNGSSGADVTSTELDALSSNQMIDIINGIDIVGIQDTINGRCRIVSDKSIENAYVAVVLSFREEKAQRRLQGIRRSIVRIFPIGTIQANESKRVKFTGYFPERTIADAKLDMFFFNGAGEAVATNISRAIKEITPEQLEKFRELEELESAG